MNLSASKLKGRHKTGRIYLILTVGIMSAVLLVVFFLYRQTQTTLTPPQPEFDPQKCVRLLDISRVYRISAHPNNPYVLWFATAEGVRVFDNETAEWTRLGLDHGLPDEVVSDITFSGETPWVGTWSGIGIFEGADTTFNPLVPDDPRHQGRVLAVESHGNDTVFFSVDGKGLFRAVGQDLVEPVTVPGASRDLRITCLKSLPEGLYIGVEDRKLFFVPTGGESPREIGFSSPSAESPETLIWDVMNHNGKLWVTTSDDGVYVREQRGDSLRQVKEFPAKGAYAFAEEDDGFWCGTPFGLWRYHDEGEVWIQFLHPEQEEPTDFQVFALANTPREVWYGSMDLGAGYFVKENVEWKPMRAGLSNPNVATVAANDSILWAGYGYQAGFLDRFGTQGLQYDRNFSLRDGLYDNHIQVLRLHGDRMYYGGYEGFGYVTINGWRFTHFRKKNGLPHTDIAAIHSEDSLVWLGSLFGLIEFDPEDDSFRTIPETESYRVTSIFRQGDSLWLGTLARGALVFDLTTGQITGKYVESARRITAILPSGEHENSPVWIVTESDGIFEVSLPSGKSSPIRPPAGILKGGFEEVRNNVLAAARIGDRIWLGTEEEGCMVYNLTTDTWSTFTYLNGLVTNRIRSFASSESFVFIGSYGGLVRVDKRYLDRIGL